ncbi:hypothetical protein, partial [Rhizorhabdus wittichii]|uniref:hypothetical protein n=1 Tax=Rhizorhabdus wittichii TaxID=160791 RepID=UPI0012FD0188
QEVGPIWADATGATDRSAYAAYAAPTVSNPPTQSEVQGIADAVQLLSQHFVALINDLYANKALTNT